MVALAILAGAGCSPYVQGNGVYGEEDRTPVETFTGIHVSDGIEATVTSGAAQQKVIASGDANLLRDYIKTSVVTDQGSGPVLHVSIDVAGGSWSSTIPPRVVVDVGELRYVKTESDSHVAASNVSTLLLTLEAQGKSDIFVMGGGGERLEATAIGAVIDADAYPVSGGALVTLSEAGRLTLKSAGPVDGTIHNGCTLVNQGTGTCAGLVVPQGETATIQCQP